MTLFTTDPDPDLECGSDPLRKKQHDAAQERKNSAKNLDRCEKQLLVSFQPNALQQQDEVFDDVSTKSKLHGSSNGWECCFRPRSKFCHTRLFDGTNLGQEHGGTSNKPCSSHGCYSGYQCRNSGYAWYH